MNKYELLLILPGTLDEKEAEDKVAALQATLKEFVQEMEKNTLGKNRLAYPVKQIRYGYFYTIIFSAEPAKVKQINEKLLLARDFLRATVFNFNEKASAQKTINFAEDRPVRQFEEAPRRAPRIERAPEAVEPVAAPSVSAPITKEMDLKEIDEKLNEILADDNLVSGV